MATFSMAAILQISTHWSFRFVFSFRFQIKKDFLLSRKNVIVLTLKIYGHPTYHTVLNDVYEVLTFMTTNNWDKFSQSLEMPRGVLTNGMGPLFISSILEHSADPYNEGGSYKRAFDIQ